MTDDFAKSGPTPPPRSARANPHHADHDPAPDAPRMARPWRGQVDNDYTPANGSAMPPAAHGGFKLSIADIYYVFFKHKWKIVAFALAGFIASGVVYVRWPVVYVSQAKILIRYIQETTAPTAAAGDGQIKSADARGTAIIVNEVEILTSFDLAEQVATAIGPERILGANHPQPSRQTAAVAVAEGLAVDAPRNGTTISAAFRHSNAELVQPILSQIVDSYQKKHAQVHRAQGVYDDFLTHETDQLRARLTQTEEELRKAKEKAGILSLDDRTYFTQQIAQLRQEIRAAEANLAERKAILDNLAGTNTTVEAPKGETVESPLPAEALSEYRRVSSALDVLYRREQELLLQFTSQSELVKSNRAQIDQNEARKASLEEEHPRLTGVRVPGQSAPARVGASDFDPVLESARIKAGESRIAMLNEQLARLRAEAAVVAEVTPVISELERRIGIEAGQYEYFRRNLEKARFDEALGAGRNTNINVVQQPTPPARDVGKMLKIVGGLAVGGLVFGLALAFALELFIDHSVKRASEVEESLNLPLFISIPKSSSNGRAKRKALRAGKRANSGAPPAGGAEGTTAVVPWSANNDLRAYFEALRDKLVFYFEVRNITRKPKLVAVTAVSDHSGVSTVAAGIAATLSEIGEGNVLLVDMNPGHGAPQFFHKGDAKLGLNEALDHSRRNEASISDNLYMVSHASGDDRLARVMPSRFGHLVPRLKASDYDYIIFDLPRMSQISATPQLARYMDLTLMVVESEKDLKNVVRRAGESLQDAGANVGVVLNKTRTYVPTALDHDTVGG